MVDQAIGVLTQGNDMDPGVARALLQLAAARQRVRVADVAVTIIAAATRGR